MSLDVFLDKVRQNEALAFADVLALIGEQYDYQPTEFCNGELVNVAGSNEGSCKVFSFAKLHDLTEAQTLSLFGEHYRDVLADPNGSGHQNIRQFMQSGWQGIVFKGVALVAK